LLGRWRRDGYGADGYETDASTDEWMSRKREEKENRGWRKKENTEIKEKEIRGNMQESTDTASL
jgi:hypothetical protein